MKEFPQLCFPPHNFNLKVEGGKTMIFDEIRKKWIVCEPEEWVRQNLIHFLMQYCSFPQAFITLEQVVKIANRNLRFDALIYDRNIKPLLIIECKAPSVHLTQKVFDQIWNYNLTINAPYFLITNGLDIVMGEYNRQTGVKFFDKVMTFEELTADV
ncbi:MAG: type I restriction enzyme HsdR N-terminal domain-containing protein [Bacteroidales bacterium]|nr:type I restriction enzyme HsdR N-terminal domain-containing protein [Bacteroidales bacterium]